MTLNSYLYGSGTLDAAGPGVKPRQPDLKDHILLVNSIPSLCSDGSPPPWGQKEACKTPTMSSFIVQVELRSQSRPLLKKIKTYLKKIF